MGKVLIAAGGGIKNQNGLTPYDTLWTQPILTSNGVIGGNTFAVESVGNNGASYMEYMVFDGKNYPPQASSFWSKNETLSSKVWYKIYNPKPLKIKKIVYDAIAHSGDYGVVTAGTLYGSNDNVNWDYLTYWETDFSNINDITKNLGRVTIDLSFNNNYYTCYRFNILRSSDDDEGAGTETTFTDMFITGYYDSRVEDILWVQPNLTANGTLGGASCAVATSSQYDTSHPGWKCMNRKDNGYWTSSGVAQDATWITMYNPFPLKVTNIGYEAFHNAGDFGVYLSGKVYASNDNSSWTELTTWNSNYSYSGTDQNYDLGWVDIDLSNNTNYYKYYKLAQLTSSDSEETGSVESGFTQLFWTAYYQL